MAFGGGLLYEEELFSSLVVLVTLLDGLGTGIILPGDNVSEFGPKVEPKSWLLGGVFCMRKSSSAVYLV